MSTTKRIYGGDYNIVTETDQANINMYTDTVFISGNLVVGGNATAVSKTDLDVTDNIIVLNKGETGAGVTLGYSGIQIDRGTAPYVYIEYRESDQKWIATEDGTTVKYLLTSTSGGTIHVKDDTAPQLGGNLDVLTRTIFSSSTQQVKIDSNLALIVDTVTPTAISNYNTIYATTPAGGGSGVYQTSLSNSDELASRNRALLFSLVL